MTKATPATIHLTPDQSADPGKCGSCEFFRRIESAAVGSGYCTFKLPPHAMRVPYSEANEQPERIYDTGSCDLYRSMNVQFTKQIYWNVP